MKISKNKFVSTEYELFVDGENGGELELMERATKEQPMRFVFGIGMMLQKFEDNLIGLEAGSKYEFTIEADDAYGDYLEENIIDLDRSIFEINGKLDDEVIFAGNIVPLVDSEGNRLNAQILDVNSSYVKVDLNHPLAGETLHFKGKILEVRDSTEQDLNEFLGYGKCSGCGNDCGDNHECDSEHDSHHCGCKCN
ncbi:MAG: FKBP-type peptidyl-prolyl cis-trans isomerase SlyD [Bacteroidetes bacterium ADurb.Bin174]|jgi:FKBP-type peptidyl-prolyl cis-trans isomerase SlyD|nr:MAG: FKBP-type peptidyl-prolyl cis-trans isomerase SlyD [Bacteroidetes bacterium ADurb.Bin174]